MKTSTISSIIIAALLAINVNLFANKANSANPTTTTSTEISLTLLAPTTPAEATFDDMPAEMPSFADLAPTTPAAADFEDTVDDDTTDLGSFAPVTPAEADFE